MTETTNLELVEKNQHVTTETIIQDIVDTEAEIVQMNKGIQSRQGFIDQLKLILAAREN